MKKVDLITKSFDMVNKGKSGLPPHSDPTNELEELHFELTYQCNQKCVMCNIWNRYQLNPSLKNEELTFDEIKRFVENSEYLKKIKLVILSGGEPFLRDDIVDLCGYFSKRYPNLSLGILSNLFHTRLTLEKLQEINDLYHPSDLWIGSSLDGLNEKHDEIRGVNGAFNALTKTIQVMRSKLPNVRISLNFTLTPRNYRELLPAFRFAKDWGMDFSAQFAVPWENAETYSWNLEILEEIEEKLDIILQEIIEDYRARGILQEMTESIDIGLLSKIYYWKGLTLYQKNPQRFFKRCVAGAKFAIFSPNGDLYFCPILKDRIVGNIRDYNYYFDTLWISNAGNRIREFINRGNCHCWLNCTIYPNAGEAIKYAQTSVERSFGFIGELLRRKQ
jgi:MoaA/NifB/PqqE/SkfB family radical SAM enzyme